MTTRLRLFAGLLLALAAILGYGSATDPQFWLTNAQRGDRLMAEKRFKEAAEAYSDPWQVGVAQYRNGDFKEAAPTFARVPGAAGAFDQGNALLMHGAYGEAIASYDRALGFRPGWQEAIDNKALAAARKKAIDDAGANRAAESAEAYDPDQVVTDPEGDDQPGEPQDMNGESMSDAELRSTWLRRVQTTPGDFLRAKFAYQAAHAEKGDDSGQGDAP